MVRKDRDYESGGVKRVPVDRRKVLKYLGGTAAIASAGGTAAVLLNGHNRVETVQEAIGNIEDKAHFDAEAEARQLNEESYEAVMRLDQLARKVLDSEGEPMYNAVAEELDAEGHHLFGENNEVLTNMKTFYDYLGKFNATRREGDQQVTEYTVEVPGLENKVKYTASAEEMRDMEQKEDDEDAFKYELEEETYWKEFVNGLEPAQ